MYFRKIIIALLIGASGLSFGQSNEDFTQVFKCANDLERIYPFMLSGRVSKEDQNRFFHCVYSAVQLLSKPSVVRHSADRDYFTKGEIRKLFTEILEIDQETAEVVLANFFLLKHLVVGGERDQLADAELHTLETLVYPYGDIYWIVHAEIPTILKIFNKKERDSVSEKQLQATLDRLGAGLAALQKAHQDKKLTYSINDFNNLVDYLGEYQGAQKGSDWDNYAVFLKSWMSGLLSPEGVIKEKNQWGHYLGSLNKMLHTIFYYERYVSDKDLSDPKVFAKLLKSVRFFTESFSYAAYFNKPGFPVKNLDTMLSAVTELAKKHPASREMIQDLFPELLNEQSQPISLFTRAFICFSLSQGKNNSGCSVEGLDGGVKYTFPDGTFTVNTKGQEWSFDDTPFYITTAQAQVLVNWLHSYNKAYNNYSGLTEAKKHSFDHWLKGQFDEDKDSQRIVFYPEKKVNINKLTKLPYNILDYKLLLNLLSASYSDSKGVFSEDQWEKMSKEIVPALIAFQSEKYDTTLQTQFVDAFGYADKLLNSSNYDKKVSQGEALDLVIHLTSAVTNSDYAYSLFEENCQTVNYECASDQFEQNADEVLKSLPLLAKSFKADPSTYKPRVKHILQKAQAKANSLEVFDLIEVFVLLQVLEVQLHTLDTNNNSLLESAELDVFTRKFSDIHEDIFHLNNEAQAESFIKFSLKTGNIPFFKQGDNTFHSTQFFRWHTYERKTDKFSISRTNLFSVFFDFYDFI